MRGCVSSTQVICISVRVFTVDRSFRIEVLDHNFPESLKRNFQSQAEEIARQCVQAPIKKTLK